MQGDILKRGKQFFLSTVRDRLLRIAPNVAIFPKDTVGLATNTRGLANQSGFAEISSETRRHSVHTCN